MISPPNKKQRSKVQRQKAALRKELWPTLDEKTLWSWEKSKGWLNIPRAMPLIMRIMDLMSKGRPLSSTYLDLWCRTYDNSLVIANNQREMAFASGFSGERAERTWAARMQLLADFGFVKIEDGPNGAISYVLILDPFPILADHHEKKNIDSASYRALLQRISETGGTDLSQPENEIAVEDSTGGQAAALSSGAPSPVFSTPPPQPAASPQPSATPPTPPPPSTTS